MNPLLRVLGAGLLVLAAFPVSSAHSTLPGNLEAASLEFPTEANPAFELLDESIQSVGEPLNVVLPSSNHYDALRPAQQGTYSVSFTCPIPATGGESDCPWRIVDTQDLLGNIALTIDPVLETDRMFFASLHGGPAKGPTPLSRQGQTHTTFSYIGKNVPFVNTFGWRDQPYTPPNPPGSGSFGEDVHATIDPTGTLYVASLYSKRASGGWKYTIAQWKFDSTINILDYEPPNQVFVNRVTGSAIENVWLTNHFEVNRVSLLWRERAPEGQTVKINGVDQIQWLAGAFTKMDAYSPWKPLADNLVLGPCSDISNPAIFKSRVYYACKAASGYNHLKKVKENDWVLHQIDLRGNTTKAVGKSNLHGANATLAIDETGRMALTTVEVLPNNQTKAHVTTSTNGGQRWSNVYEFGDDLRIRDPLTNKTYGLQDARITAMHYRTTSNTIHLIYEEEASEQDIAKEETQWRKSYAVIDPIGTVLSNQNLNVSDKGEVFFGRGPKDATIYGDMRDTLLDVNGRLFIGFSDYAVFSFAEILEDDQRTMEVAFQQPPPPPEPVPAPEAAGLLTSQGAAAGLVSVIALRRLAAHRFAIGAGRGR